jgi:3-deoxy-7-phosphoheptulonate synthase
VGQIKAGNRKIIGIMLESYLLEGSQPYAHAGLKRGISITDSCISFETTEKIIMEGYHLLRNS